MIQNLSIDDSWCIYCSNTGRTKEDPYKCSHCGRNFMNKEDQEDKISLEEVKKNFGYIRNLSIAENWEGQFIRNYLIGLGKKVTSNDYYKINYLQSKLDDASTNSLFNDQIIIYMNPHLYEILIYWAYKLTMVCYKENYNILGIIYNINLIGDIYNSPNLISEQVLFIEYNNQSTRNLEKLFEILSIRKRSGLPTFVLTTQSYKTFFDGGRFSVTECKDLKQMTDSLSIASYI